MNQFFSKMLRFFFPHQDREQIKRDYGMPKDINCTIRVTPDGWFTVSIPEMPGLITEANTHQGLLEMINDAVLTYYDVPKRKADIVYNQLNVGNTVIQYQGQLQTRPA